jgi:DNA mismatch endonuclease (patch repair protein)
VTDIYSSEKRSEIMSKVRSKDTKPEMLVRSSLHALGYRYRLHVKELPGNPDIVLPKYHTVIFVHGCFWHQHPGCNKASLPKANSEFWKRKLNDNINRDNKVCQKLKVSGWNIITLWECEIERNIRAIISQVDRQLKMLS